MKSAALMGGTENLEASTSAVTVLIWATLAFTPRIMSFQFEDWDEAVLAEVL